MKVCVVGAGNMGLAMASVLAMDEKYEPVLYTGKQIDTEALILDDVENGVKYQDFAFDVEGDIAKALDGAEYVFVTWPAFLRRRFAEQATPHLGKGAKVGFVPGYGGAEYMCKEMIENGVVVFGFQRVPYVARKTDTEATIQSRKNELFLASIPKDALPQICKDVEEMFHIPTVALKEYLAVFMISSRISRTELRMKGIRCSMSSGEMRPAASCSRMMMSCRKSAAGWRRWICRKSFL